MTERTTKNCGWYFEPELINELKAAAKKRGLKTASLARMILVMWLEREERHVKV